MSKSKIRLAVDFDGTIAATMSGLAGLAIDVMATHFHMTPDETVKWYRATAGLTFREQVRELGRGEAAQQRAAVSQFMQDKVLITLQAVPFKDVPELYRLASTTELCLVSSTTTKLVHEWLFRHELYDLWSQIRGWQKGSGKHTQIADFGAQFFLGDTNHDAWYAKAAGAQFLGLRRSLLYLSNENTYATTLTEFVERFQTGVPPYAV